MRDGVTIPTIETRVDKMLSKNNHRLIGSNMRDDLLHSGATPPCAASASPAAADTTTVTLRVLSTTDLHMQLLGHDYVKDQPLDHHGLAGLAGLIKTARQDAMSKGYATLLLDNGDIFQGNALGDYLARQPANAQNPAVAVLNQLQYDAIGVGNHDLDHGLGYLQAIAGALDMPVISTNLALKDPGKLRNSVLLRRPLGRGGSLGIGLISVLPEHAAIWNSQTLGAENTVLPAAACVIREIGHLRGQGADIIILMAHMGLRCDAVDDVLRLARIDGLDALITGHTHRRFPGLDHPSRPGVDPSTGRLAGQPAVMAGHHGSDLGVLDLRITRNRDGALEVSSHTSTLHRNHKGLAPDKQIKALAMPAHLATRKELRRSVGHTDKPIHSYFSFAVPTRTSALIARAQAHVVRKAMNGLPESRFPLVAAVSAQTAGGQGGPGNYLHIPAGPVRRRHLAGLAPYADHICALRITGRGLRAWLEHAAKAYHQLLPDQPDQDLINPALPSFNFDTVYGLNYVIDPTRPIGNRIRQMTCNSAPVTADQQFVLATNRFRAGGGGGYAMVKDTMVLHRSKITVEDALAQDFAAPSADFWKQDKPWRLSSAAGTQALLKTAPEALDHLSDIADFHPEIRPSSPDGFAVLRLTL